MDDRSETVLIFRRSTPDGESFDVAIELTGEDELSSAQLPGFSLPLERLFRS